MIICRSVEEFLEKLKNNNMSELDFDDSNKYEELVEYSMKKFNEANEGIYAYVLGNCFYHGKGIGKDYEKAFYFCELAAKQGHAKAQYNLAVFYDNGIGVPQDYEKSFYFYKLAAKQGLAEAQYNLALYYENGEGVSQDYKKAAYYYELAANQGHAKAQQNLGYCYYNGQGVSQDYKKAAYYYELAANQGDAYAQQNLAICYYNGEGVTQDYKKAYYYFELAANQGDEYAKYNLALYYNSEKEEHQDYKKAIYYYKKAAKKGVVNAQYDLGLMYYYGNGVKENAKKALYYFNLASKKGFILAQNTLGYLYSGYGFFALRMGVSQDYTKAVYYFELAANQGDADAQKNLGYCYYHGQGVTQDYTKAVYYFELAANQGVSGAQYNLANCYYNGEGVKQDLSKALEWVNKAIDNGLSYAKKLKDEIEKEIKNEENKSKEDLNFHINSRHDVFISWNHNDSEIMEKTYKKIEENGFFTCWHSNRDCNGEIEKACFDAINESSLFIVFITSNSLKSEWVKKEIQTALNKWKFDKLKIKPIISNKALDILNKTKENKDNLKNPFLEVIEIGSIFINNEDDLTDEELNNIYSFVKKESLNYILNEYKIVTKENNKLFDGTLTNTVIKNGNEIKSVNNNENYINNNYTNNIVKTQMNIVDDYVTPSLYNKRDEIFDFNNNSIIYGEGGAGKSLFVQRLMYDYSDEFVFFKLRAINTIKNIMDKDVFEILADSFLDSFKDAKYASLNRDIIKEYVKQILKDNKVCIILDGLDEISKDEKINLYEIISNVSNNTYFIFTSRSLEDKNLIEKYFTKELKEYKLNGFSEDDVKELFNNIIKKNNVKGNINIDKILDRINQIFNDSKNPLWIFNYIIVCIINGEYLNKRYEIMRLLIDVFEENVRKQRDLLITNNEIVENNIIGFLEYFAFQRTSGNKEDVEDLLKEYLNDNNIMNDSVFKDMMYYLNSRGIIKGGEFSHNTYRDYYSSKYCYKNGYEKQKGNGAFTKSWICYKNDVDIDVIKEIIGLTDDGLACLKNLFLILDNEIYKINSPKDKKDVLLDIYKIDEIATEIDDLYKQNQLFNEDIFKK